MSPKKKDKNTSAPGSAVTPKTDPSDHEETTDSRISSPPSQNPANDIGHEFPAKRFAEGERKHITVLFADIARSTEFVERLEADAAIEILDRTVDCMLEAVHQHGGLVNLITGDGIMALFGVPRTLEDHAIRACFAALDMHRRVGAQQETLERELGAGPLIRVGINSGVGLVKSIGSDLRLDYTAHGMVTHTAARFEGLANVGSTLVGLSTMRLAQEQFVFERRGATEIRGMSAPIETFDLTGLREEATTSRSSRHQNSSPIIGRGMEVGVMESAILSASNSAGQIVELTGDMGVGKSRISDEFLDMAADAGFNVARTASRSYGKGIAIRPAVQLLRDFLGIDPRATPDEIARAINPRIEDTNSTSNVDTSLLTSFLFGSAPKSSKNQLSPAELRARTLRAICQLIIASSREKPVCLLFEDLQWADDETRYILNQVTERISDAAVILIVSKRPELQINWHEHLPVGKLILSPFDVTQINEFLAPMFKDRTVPAGFGHRLYQMTQGNPLFLEESIREFEETGVLDGTPGDYVLVKSTVEITVPESLHAMLAARFDRLSTDLRELTQYAAVLGERFTAPVLKSLSKNKNIDFDVAMDKIVKSGLVVEHSNETSLEYSFAHTLIHDVIYQSLPGRIQKRLHGEVLQCLEDLTGEDTVGHAHLLGHHAFACQDWQKALKYNQAAGNEALSRSASDDAIRYLDNALVAVKNLTKDEDLSRTELDLLFGLRTAYLPLGMLDKIKDCLIEAEKLCASLNDRGLMGKINAHKTGYLYLAGQQRKAINAGIRALKVAVERKDSEFESDISFRLGQCYYATGAYKSAVGHLSRSIEYLSGEHVFDRLGTPGLPSVTARAWLAASLAELGESDRAISQAHEGLDLAKQANQPYGLIHAVWGLYQAYSRCGDFSKAVPHLEEALKIFDNWHIPLWYPPIISCLGVSYLHTGHTTKALQLLTEAVERAGELKSDVHKATLVAHLGRGQRATGQLVEAGKSLSTAIKIARKNGERGEEAWALWCRGYQQMDIGKAKFADAEADYKASLMISEQLEMQPLSTNCKSALSELYSRMDRD